MLENTTDGHRDLQWSKDRLILGLHRDWVVFCEAFEKRITMDVRSSSADLNYAHSQIQHLVRLIRN